MKTEPLRSGQSSIHFTKENFEEDGAPGFEIYLEFPTVYADDLMDLAEALRDTAIDLVRQKAQVS